MLTAHEIWASSCSFMNDPDEDRFADTALIQGAHLAGGTPWGLSAGAIESFLVTPSQHAFARRFIVCASRGEDSLELWRSYGPAAVLGTFAIGLDPQVALSPVGLRRDEFASNPDRWVDVAYDSLERTAERARDLLLAARQPFEEHYRKLQEEGSFLLQHPRALMGANLAGDGFVSDIRDDLVAISKHEAYRSEREVRITFTLSPSTSTSYRLRPGPHGPIPYLALTRASAWGEAAPEPQRLPVRSVIAAPNAPRTALQGVAATLERGGYKPFHSSETSSRGAGERDDGRVELRTSTVPFV